jgi:hypothetical protein
VEEKLVATYETREEKITIGGNNNSSTTIAYAT